MQTCRHCGEKLGDEYIICPSCGRSLGRKIAPAKVAAIGIGGMFLLGLIVKFFTVGLIDAVWPF